MVKEIAWYLESGRFRSLVEELEMSLRNYEEAKKAGHGEDILETLREDTRSLFEWHCVRSGMRENEMPFINIDAEFFNGNTLDESAMNGFIKNIIKGHCFQKVLWTYMGTTGSFTAISRAEMAKAGLQYDDYLPLEYRKNHRVKKPLEELSGMETELFYMYGDGTVSKEYNAEKAKINFNTLEDKSGINWKVGYDPNDSVRKDGWHGEYDYSGVWVRVDERDGDNSAGSFSGAITIELIRNGDSAILYDPGMLLLSLPVMMYLTDSGETYGNLSMDKEGTVQRIKETLKKMGITKISAIGGIAADKPELLSSYQTLLGDMAFPELYIADSKRISEIKEVHMKVAAETASEDFGIALERKLRIVGKHNADATSVLSAISNGSAAVPLSPRKMSDGMALGLSEKEVNEINSMHINHEHAAAYDTVLSNLFASWTYYEGGLSRVETARLVNEYMENDELREKNEPLLITAQTSLEEIIGGGKKVERNDVRTFASGIPGVFSEPAVIDFYDEKAKEKYLKTLERKQILPRGGAVSTLAALETLPAAGGEKKAELSRGLTRALGQYKAIAMSVGMPLKELIEVVKASAGFGESVNDAVLKRKIYYELSVKNIIDEAKKENLQTKEMSLENDVVSAGESVIVVGGIQGPALDEVLLTREKLLDRGFSEEEADNALPFLHGIRFASSDFVIPALLLEILNNDKIKTAVELRQSVLSALDADDSISYNLSTSEGLQAYFESGRATGSKVSKKDIHTLLKEDKVPLSVPVSATNISRVEPRYKAQGDVVPLSRNVPRGSPEKIRPASIVMERELPALVFDGGDKSTGVNVVDLTGFGKETLELEYGYSKNEAEETVRYLRGITIPAGKESYFKQELAPVFEALLKGTNKVGVLKEHVRETFGKLRGTSVDVVELTGLGKETLELEYGYSKNEAEEIVRYFRGITIPAGKENFFKHNYAPVFTELLKGTNKAEVLRERVMERFGRIGGASSSSTAMWNTSSSGFSGAVPLEFTPVRDMLDNANTGGEISSSVFSSAATTVSRHRAGGAVNYEQRDAREDAADITATENIERHRVHEDVATGGAADIAATENAEHTVNIPMWQARDAELERLRKVEENYERDKAALALERQPAFARSESHDVGHAEGVKEEEDLHKIAYLRRKDILKELRRRKGV